MSQNVLQIPLNATNLYDLLYIYITFHYILFLIARNLLFIS